MASSTGESTIRPPGSGRERRQIGQQLRAVRLASGLSLRALAARAGVTASLLSQVETGRVNPSVDTLFALAEALKVEIADLFPPDHTRPPRTPNSSGPVVRRPARRRIELEHGVVWESLLPSEEHGLEFMEIRYAPGFSAPQMQRHGGRDYGVVIRGSLTIALGFTEYVLHEGDAIAFDATTPHLLRNDTDAEAAAVWLVMERHSANSLP